MVYGQTEATHDLNETQNAIGATILRDVADVKLHNLTSDARSAAFSKDGATTRLESDCVAGCDGFHGASRQSWLD